MNDPAGKSLEERVADLEKAVFAALPAELRMPEEPDPLAAGYARFRARLEEETR